MNNPEMPFSGTPLGNVLSGVVPQLALPPGRIVLPCNPHLQSVLPIIHEMSSI